MSKRETPNATTLSPDQDPTDQIMGENYVFASKKILRSIEEDLQVKREIREAEASYSQHEYVKMSEVG